VSEHWGLKLKRAAIRPGRRRPFRARRMNDWRVTTQTCRRGLEPWSTTPWSGLSRRVKGSLKPWGRFHPPWPLEVAISPSTGEFSTAAPIIMLSHGPAVALEFAAHRRLRTWSVHRESCVGRAFQRLAVFSSAFIKLAPTVKKTSRQPNNNIGRPAPEARDGVSDTRERLLVAPSSWPVAWA
jgi:hypothetical protein